jgi:hypothetical protein
VTDGRHLPPHGRPTRRSAAVPSHRAAPSRRAARRRAARRGDEDFWSHDGLAELERRRRPTSQGPAVEPDEVRPSALRRAGRALGVAGGGAALLGALAVGLFPTQTFLEQRADTAEVQERLEVLRTQNEAFEDRIEALQTDEEIERVAREQYNLAYPGEEAYAVLPAPLPPLDLPPLWPYGEIYDPALSSGEVDASLDAP